MKGGLHIKIKEGKKGIAYFFLFIFCSLLLVEGLHSHKTGRSLQVHHAAPFGRSVIKQSHAVCKVCDHLLHHSQCVLPATCQVDTALVKTIWAFEVFKKLLVYKTVDHLLFSGNSPPLV